ncbi:hypothetical protein NYA22BAC_01676 [Parasphingorhabdus sp. NYA22]
MILSSFFVPAKAGTSADYTQTPATPACAGVTEVQYV